jgi:hypothetical protein
LVFRFQAYLQQLSFSAAFRRDVATVSLITNPRLAALFDTNLKTSLQPAQCSGASTDHVQGLQQETLPKHYAAGGSGYLKLITNSYTKVHNRVHGTHTHMHVHNSDEFGDIPLNTRVTNIVSLFGRCSAPCCCCSALPLHPAQQLPRCSSASQALQGSPWPVQDPLRQGLAQCPCRYTS